VTDIEARLHDSTSNKRTLQRVSLRLLTAWHCGTAVYFTVISSVLFRVWIELSNETKWNCWSLMVIW